MDDTLDNTVYDTLDGILDDIVDTNPVGTLNGTMGNVEMKQLHIVATRHNQNVTFQFFSSSKAVK